MFNRSLGDLIFMRVWHDNSGSGSNASWYLKYIVVTDVQTSIKFFFANERWLAVDEDDGCVSVPFYQLDHFVAYFYNFFI